MYFRSGSKSRFEEVFLNPLVQNPPDDAFLLNDARDGLLNSGHTLAEKAPLIGAALGIRQDDLNQALSRLSLSSADVTLDSLLVLYRVAGVAQALDLSIPDYFAIISLTAAAPFENTAALVRFCKTVKFIQNSGFNVQELAYLLQQDASAASMLDLTADRVAQALKGIRCAVQAKLGSIEQQVRNIIAKNCGGPTVKRVLSGYGHACHRLPARRQRFRRDPRSEIATRWPQRHEHHLGR